LGSFLIRDPGTIYKRMEPKPEFLGRQFAASFEDASVAEAYRFRPPYSPQTFDILQPLIRDKPRRVLDAGCGTGALARPLVHLAERVDAVDASPAMIDQGNKLPGGSHPQLHWLVGRIEEVHLAGPYSLITAGNSLHWMEWAVVMPLFGRLLSPNGVLAIVESANRPPPWQAALVDILRRYSTNQGFQPFQLLDELVRRGLFSEQGRMQTEPFIFQQPLEEYVESFHARSSFSRQRMKPEDAAGFDLAVEQLVRTYEPGMVHLEISNVYWGLPHAKENLFRGGSTTK
jgi:SAM-dependent methyltransferase